jgi:hypothetical protein
VTKKRLRSQLALSGGIGLAGGVALMGGALFLLARTGLEPLVTGWVAWLLLAGVLGFSLAEIPVMVFGMRQMASGTSGNRLIVVTNAAFTSFAAVYAVPFLVLTGRVGIGIALAGLGLVRFFSALWFVPTAKFRGRD